MEYTFLYEKALAEKGLKKSTLSPELKAEVDNVISLCRDLADLPDEDIDGAEKLNAKIDDLDESVAKKIDSLKVDAPEPTQEPTPKPEGEEQKSNTGAILVGFALVGGLIYGAIKMFGGQSNK